MTETRCVSQLVSIAIVAMAVLFMSACVGDNPDYCDESKPCPSGQTCHPTQHRCLPIADGAVDLAVDGSGTDGVQVDGAGKQDNGTSCSKAEKCTSGYCVDGRCCNGACGEPCKSCDLAGKAGICSFVPAGEDPRKDCGGDSCSAGMLSKKACDGKGVCSTTSTSCGDYTCNAGKDACLTTCSKNGECTSKLCDLHTTKNTCPTATAVCFVDANAGSGGSGTMAKPYDTIGKCLATSKGYISVADGTYTENLVISGKTVQIVAQSEPGSVFDGASPKVNLRQKDKLNDAIDVNSKAQMVMRGFDVGVGSENAKLVGVGGGASLTVTSCRIHSSKYYCLSAGGQANLSVQDTVVDTCTNFSISATASGLALDHVMVTNGGGINYDVDAAPPNSFPFSARQVVAKKNDEGIMIRGAVKPVLDRIITQDNTGTGISLDNVSGAMISNVLSTGNKFGLLWTGSICSTCPSSALSNVTIAFNSGTEVQCLGPSGTEKLNITNSIVWDTAGKAIDGSMCTVTYSDVFGGGAGTTSINKDPLFVSPSTGNYKLSNTSSMKSPCIDAGDPVAKNLPKTDLDGAPRVVNGIVDMGAYEAK